MIKIFQINPEKDTNKVKFKSYKFIKEFDFSIYDEVWSGNEPELENYNNLLEEIFKIFNLHHPEDFHGHSLSVSDVVQIINSDKKDNGYYYCDSFGWVKLEIE